MIDKDRLAEARRVYLGCKSVSVDDTMTQVLTNDDAFRAARAPAVMVTDAMVESVSAALWPQFAPLPLERWQWGPAVRRALEVALGVGKLMKAPPESTPPLVELAEKAAVGYERWLTASPWLSPNSEDSIVMTAQAAAWRALAAWHRKQP